MANKILAVGINNYPTSPLRGPVYDAQHITQVMLGMFRTGPDPRPYRYFTASASLFNEQASIRGMVTAWHDVIAQANPGERLLIFMSGHGTQHTDSTGDETSDDLDECFVSQDMWGVADDSWASLLADAKPGVSIDVVMDCCHSGGITSSRLLDDGFRTRSITQAAFEAAGGKYQAKENSRKKLIQIITEGNHCLWAACAPEDLSVEAQIGGQWQGLFSYWFAKSMVSNREFTRRQHMDWIAANVTGMYTDQVPQLECTAEVADTVPFPARE